MAHGVSAGLFPIHPSIDSLGDPPAVPDPLPIQAVPEGRRTAQAAAPEPLGQDDAEEVYGAGQDAGGEGDEAVEDGARVDVAAHARPLDLALGLGQGRGREPAHAERQGQRVADDQALGLAALHVAERAGAVGDARVQDARVVRVDVVLRRRVQQHVEVGADVQVALLQGARERKHQRDVLLLVGGLADGLDVRRGPRRQAAGQGRVAVDVELEQVEEGVVDHGDGAIDLALVAVAELERLGRLVAHGKGDPLDLVVGILDVLARFSVSRRRVFVSQYARPR